MQITKLVGQRVSLLPLDSAHTEELFTAGRSAEIWPYMFMNIESIADMEGNVRLALEEMKKNNEYTYVIVDHTSNQIVGSTRLHDFLNKHRQIEIGSTWLSPKAWGTSINAECKYLLLEYCFESLNMIRVQFKTDERNIRSQKALEKIGATKEALLRQHRILPGGYIRNTVMYSIIDEEWTQIKRNLEALLSFR